MFVPAAAGAQQERRPPQPMRRSGWRVHGCQPKVASFHWRLDSYESLITDAWTGRRESGSLPVADTGMIPRRLTSQSKLEL